MSDKTKRLGEERVALLLLKYSAPAMLGMIVNALYSVVDRIFVGQTVGKLGMAGITIIFPFSLVIMAFMMLIGIGGNALVSIRLGEKKKDEAEKILGNSFVLMMIVSVLLTVAGYIFMDPVLRLLTADSPEVMPYAKEFLIIFLGGIVFQGLGFGMNNFIRGEGNPVVAMWTMLISAILNIIFCWIFVWIMKWGVAGSALATVISQAVSGIWVLLYYVTGKSHLKVHFKNLKLQKEIVIGICAIGSAPFLLQLAAALVNAVVNIRLSSFAGDTAIAAMGAVMSVVTIIQMPIFGINQGMQPIIGYNYGAKNFLRVKRTLIMAIMMASSIVIVGFAVLQLFPHQLIAIFDNGSGGDFVNVGVHIIRVSMLTLPLIGFQIVSGNYFQCIGKPMKAAFLTLTRQMIFLLPLLLILPVFWGEEGVFLALPVSDFLATLLTGTFIIREIQSLNLQSTQDPS